MFPGQVMKSIFQPENEDNTSCMNHHINFSDFFFLFSFFKVKHEHAKRVYTLTVVESLLLFMGFFFLTVISLDFFGSLYIC